MEIKERKAKQRRVSGAEFTPVTFLKHGRKGQPHRRTLELSTAPKEPCFRWGKGKREIRVKDIVDIRMGLLTAVFRKAKLEDSKENNCASLVTMNRTVDLEFDSKVERDSAVKRIEGIFERVTGSKLMTGVGVRRNSVIKQQKEFIMLVKQNVEELHTKAFEIWQKGMSGAPNKNVKEDFPRLAKNFQIVTVTTAVDSILEEDDLDSDLHSSDIELDSDGRISASNTPRRSGKVHAFSDDGKESVDAETKAVTVKHLQVSTGKYTQSTPVRLVVGAGGALPKMHFEPAFGQVQTGTFTRLDKCELTERPSYNVREAMRAMTSVLCTPSRAGSLMGSLDAQMNILDNDEKQDMTKLLKKWLDSEFAEVAGSLPPLVIRQISDRPPELDNIRGLMSILKVCNQNIIAPAVYMLKKVVLPPHSTHDFGVGGWVITIEFHDSMTIVTHTRKEVSEASQFNYTYAFSTKFSLSYDLIEAELRILDLTFEEDCPTATRGDLSFKLFSINHESLLLNQRMRRGNTVDKGAVNQNQRPRGLSLESAATTNRTKRKENYSSVS